MSSADCVKAVLGDQWRAAARFPPAVFAVSFACEREPDPVCGAARCGRCRCGSGHRRGSSRAAPTATLSASMCWRLPPRTASTRRPPSRRSCMRRSSAYSNCRGTCCARPAAACSTSPPRSRTCTRRPMNARCAAARSRCRSTRWSRWCSPSARASARSPRTIRAACRSGTITGKCSGARRSICPTPTWRS